MFKPESIANRQPQIQIMDTHEPSEARASIGLAANCHQINRTLLMQEQEFKNYLRRHHRSANDGALNESTIRSRIGNCKTIETHEGDLDDLFDRDRLADLLSRLNYSTADQQARKPLRHKIPIDGDWRNGSATLKAAAKLYKSFRAHSTEFQPQSVTTPQAQPPTPSKTSNWPQWPQPQNDDELVLAKIVARFARFLRPDIVRAIVEDNEQQRNNWSRELEQHDIDPRAYLWLGSACAFPGVRRYAGSTEIAIFRKRANGGFKNALALDDNDYPKQIWSFALTGKKFAKHGPQGYALAHLADHKHHKNRATNDFDLIEGEDQAALLGLYTSPTNTVYLPVATIRPTDFSIALRNLLKRRAAELYGSFCEPLPPWLSIRPATDSDWELDRFEWPEPVGDPQCTESFLRFRRATMDKLFESIKRTDLVNEGQSDHN